MRRSTTRSSSPYRSITGLAVSLLLVTFGATAALAQESPDGATQVEPHVPEGFRPLAIAGETTMRSKVLGEERRLLVSLPEGYEASDSNRYPVVYLLDGDGNLPHAVGALQLEAQGGELPPLIVVGVPNVAGRRSRDLTPVWRGEAQDDGLPERLAIYGESSTFRRFLVDELKPWVDERFRTASYDILVGHSFGGLFAVDSWLEEPSSFDAYVAVSPSLWWDQRRLVDDLSTTFRDPERASWPPLYATIGDEFGAILEAYRQFQLVLSHEAPDGFRWRADQHVGESHGSVVIPGIRAGLRFVFPQWQLSFRVFETGDLSALEAHYRRQSARLGFEIRTPEAQLNRLGYALVGRGEMEKAITVLERAVELYPESPNVYDSLGEAHRDAGNIDKARRLFEEAVRRAEALDDPLADAFRQHLAALDEAAP